MKTIEKETLRTELPVLTANELTMYSKQIELLLENWREFKKAKNIAFYLAMDDEISLEFLFKLGKNLFLPRYVSTSNTYEMARINSPKELTAGKYGIKEPCSRCPRAEKNELDLWFVPAMAFDLNGNRLGRGGGFYDRLLENENGIKVGVTANKRILKKLPTESWDVKMDFLITNKKIINI